LAFHICWQLFHICRFNQTWVENIVEKIASILNTYRLFLPHYFLNITVLFDVAFILLGIVSDFTYTGGLCRFHAIYIRNLEHLWILESAAVLESTPLWILRDGCVCCMYQAASSVSSHPL
jgi:hypothetical protein